jgi:predicted PurR-regulated permease PerM
MEGAMTLQRQMTFWFAALLFVCALLWLFSDILLPFVAGLALAYFLDPVADFLERHGLPRLAATLVILGASLLVVVLALVLVVPLLGGQAIALMEKLPGYAEALAALVNEVLPESVKEYLRSQVGGGSNAAADIAGKATDILTALLKSLWSGGLALVNLAALMVVTPVVAFYMLNDWDRMIAKIDGWLPREHAEVVRSLAGEVDRTLAGFIRGQGTLCLTLGAFYALALIAAGLNFGLLIGLTAGALSFIPYVGVLVGGVLSIGMAAVQFWPEWPRIAIVVAIFALGQFLEGNVLSPKLVGSSVGLHPVWLMFALFAFGYLFGFVGMLVAVPLAAVAGVLVRFALRQYLASRLYLGTAVSAEGRGEAAPPRGEA